MAEDSLNVEISEKLSEFVEKKKKVTKQNVIRYVKFFLILGWRDTEFN